LRGQVSTYQPPLESEPAWKIQLKEEIEKMRVLLKDVKPSEMGFAEKYVC